MRVYNLTDVPTQALSAAGLVNVPLNVSGVIIQPGENKEVPVLGPDADRYIRVTAIHVGDSPPKNYTPNVPQQVQAAPPAPAETAKKKGKKGGKGGKKKTLNVDTDVKPRDEIDFSGRLPGEGNKE